MNSNAAVLQENIWLIEDDADVASIFCEMLRPRFKTRIFDSLRSFEDASKNKDEKPDLLLADLNLGRDHFLRFIESGKRAEQLPCPWVIVTADEDAETLRTGFQLGASDYLIKPIRKNELLVKLENLLKLKGQSKESSKLDKYSIIFDPASLTLKKGQSQLVQLTAKEMQIFSIIYRSEKSVSKRELEQGIWGSAAVISKSLDVHIFNLRKKISTLGLSISFNVRDGYRLD